MLMHAFSSKGGGGGGGLRGPKNWTAIFVVCISCLLNCLIRLVR